MRIPSCCLGLFLLMLAYPVTTSSQELQKENIAVLQFGGWRGLDAASYQNALTDRIVTFVIQSKRFNVIDRAHLQQIMDEQKLQMTGIIDENTAVEVGKIIGVQKILVGTFTKNTVDFRKKKYSEYDENKKKEVKVADSYYNANVGVSLKLIDVESGQYGESAQADGNGKGTNENSAFSRALDDVAKNVADAFFTYFAVHGFVETMDGPYVTADVGSAQGVQRLMDFEILDITKKDLQRMGKFIISPSVKRIGFLRIVRTESNSARGRIIGDPDIVQEGQLIREIKENTTLEALIVRKEGGIALVDLGGDVGLSKGATFDVFDRDYRSAGRLEAETFGIGEKKKGKITLSQVGAQSSKGKILEGRYRIGKDMLLRETKAWKPNYTLSASYALCNVKADANMTPWKGTIGNELVESKIDSVDYRDRKDVKTGSMVKVQFGKWNQILGLSFDVDFGFYNINDDLNLSVFDVTVSKHIRIIPEVLSLYAGGGIGVGGALQKVKPEIINHLTNNENSRVNSTKFQWRGLLGIRFAIGNAFLFGEVDYTTLTFNKWQYSMTYTDENEQEKYESYPIRSELVPYPKLTLGGPNFRFGLTYNIKGLSRLFWIF